MNRDVMEGKWKQIRGDLKTQWGKLTDDDLDQIEGRAEKLAGVLQERYGWSRERSREEADRFLGRYGTDERHA